MAIGRTVEEALQKAARMLDIGHDGIVATRPIGPVKAQELLAQPGPDRVFALPWAMRNGHSIKQLHELTHIDEWFLHCIRNLVEIEDSSKPTRVDRVQKNFCLRPSAPDSPIAN